MADVYQRIEENADGHGNVLLARQAEGYVG